MTTQNYSIPIQIVAPRHDEDGFIDSTIPLHPLIPFLRGDWGMKGDADLCGGRVLDDREMVAFSITVKV